MPFTSPAYLYVYNFSGSLVPFSVCLFVPTVPRLPTHNCICIMNKGDRPCGKSDVTLKRERETEEKANPETRQRRMEYDTFFSGHTCATVSVGADTVCASVLDSVPVLVHEHLPPDLHDRLEDRLGWDHKSTKFVCLRVLLDPSLTHSLSP